MTLNDSHLLVFVLLYSALPLHVSVTYGLFLISMTWQRWGVTPMVTLNCMRLHLSSRLTLETFSLPTFKKYVVRWPVERTMW